MRSQLLTAFLFGFSAINAADAAPALFDQPERVCAALIGEGLVPGRWGRSNQGFEGTEFTAYNCLSPIMLIQGGSGPFVTSINYFAEGRTNDKVEIVKLVLNVHDRRNRDAGRAKFIEAAKALLKALYINPSATFLQALQEPRNDVFAFDGGGVRFEVWTIPVERERLTVETTTALQR
jgi:hypothetical protein